jgi:hypothetical protein
MYFTTDKGRIMQRYPGQTNHQDRYIEVYASGKILFSWNAEIGNAVPSAVWHGIIRRYDCPFTTKTQARAFYAENRDLFAAVVNGLSEKWDGNNYVGKLTPAAIDAEESIEYELRNACPEHYEV